MFNDRARATAIVVVVALALAGGFLGRSALTGSSDSSAQADVAVSGISTVSSSSTSTSIASTTSSTSTLSSVTVSSSTASLAQTTTSLPTTVPQTTTSSSTTVADPTTVPESTTSTASAGPETPDATIPEVAVEIVRPDDEVVTAGVAGPITVVNGQILRADGVVLWQEAAHPVVAIASVSETELWAITGSGALLRGDNSSLLMVGDPTGLGYTALALTNAHVVVASNSGAVVAFVRSSPSSPRLIEAPVGPDGIALPVTTMVGTGGEGLRVEAGGRVFLLSASAGGVAVDCGPIETASC